MLFWLRFAPRRHRTAQDAQHVSFGRLLLRRFFFFPRVQCRHTVAAELCRPPRTYCTRFSLMGGTHGCYAVPGDGGVGEQTKTNRGNFVKLRGRGGKP